MRGATQHPEFRAALLEFQLTRLMRGAPGAVSYLQILAPISTHAPHARRDCDGGRSPIVSLEFQLTHLMRGAILDPIAPIASDPISADENHCINADISTHAPHARRDCFRGKRHNVPHQFQLTRPMRGAAEESNCFLFAPVYFNSRAPCEARQSAARETVRMEDFNSRDSCEERQI